MFVCKEQLKSVKMGVIRNVDSRRVEERKEEECGGY